MINSQSSQVNLTLNNVPSQDMLFEMARNGQIEPNQLFMVPSKRGDGLVALKNKNIMDQSKP